jgi:hypothetical protein
VSFFHKNSHVQFELRIKKCILDYCEAKLNSSNNFWWSFLLDSVITCWIVLEMKYVDRYNLSVMFSALYISYKLCVMSHSVTVAADEAVVTFMSEVVS